MNIDETMEYGLLGESLSHSKSKKLHAFFGDYDYQLIEVAPEDLEHFVRTAPYKGLNVTIPYKKKVLPFCDKLSKLAKRIGAVNTLIRKEDGLLYGDNTDYFGFRYLLSTTFLSTKEGDREEKISFENYLPGKKALILGSGGASKTVYYALKDIGCREIIIISRTGQNNYHNLSLHADADFIINTTPVGQYPNTNKFPLSLKEFPKLLGVIDLITNPIRTALLLEAQKLGIACVGGTSMLVAQAAKASTLFTQKKVSEENLKKIVKRFRMQETNLVLVGMPGCGKTTLGKHLSKSLGRECMDIDELFTKEYGRTPAQVIEEQGEAIFRNLESHVVQKLGDYTGVIIATGGGSVLRDVNYPPLAQNSIIIFLNRPLEKLARDGRPLSSDKEALALLYQQRFPIYQAFADLEIPVQTSVEDIIDDVLKKINNALTLHK